MLRCGGSEERTHRCQTRANTKNLQTQSHLREGIIYILIPCVLDVNHAWYLVVTATNSWETRHVERGLFLAPFDFAQLVYDDNHAIIPVVTATNICESTRHVEAGPGIV